MRLSVVLSDGRARRGSGGGSLIFQLPCVPFLMSAEAVDLGEGGDEERWQALTREREEIQVGSEAVNADLCRLGVNGQ